MPNDRLRDLVATEVRSVLARQRVSGSRLAAALGTSQPWVARRLNGEVAFDLDDLQRIAVALKVRLCDLIPADALSRFWPPEGS